MLGGGKPSWLPFDLPVTDPVRKRIVRKTGLSPEEAFQSDFRHLSVKMKGESPRRWRAALEKTGFRFPERAVVGEFGISWQRPPRKSLGKAVHLREMLHPLADVDSVESLAALPWPDPSDPAHYAGLADRCAEIHASGKVASGQCECTLFEHTWYLRGMEGVFFDWADENPVTEWLLDYFTERSIHRCRAFVRAGCDHIRLGDDVASQNSLLLSAEMWRENLKPRLKRVIDAIREAAGDRRVWVQYHSDGNITALIGELIETGVDILNPMQPECVDLEAIAAEHRDRVAYSGMIGTQTTFPFGSPDDVREAVARCRRMHAQGARVIVAPTHVLEPDVPMDNIIAFAEAAAQRLLS